jgi:hypothetical protein
MADKGQWPHPHMHGEHTIPTVGDEIATVRVEGAGFKDVEISKGMCAACLVEVEYRRKHGRRGRGKRWT